MLANMDDDKEREKVLHSFVWGDQDRGMIFGMDTNTQEGRDAFKAEYDALCELAPEIIKKEDMVFPHEMAPRISDEPHFQRVWQHYREHTFKCRLAAPLTPAMSPQKMLLPLTTGSADLGTYIALHALASWPPKKTRPASRPPSKS